MERTRIPALLAAAPRQLPCRSATGSVLCSHKRVVRHSGSHSPSLPSASAAVAELATYEQCYQAHPFSRATAAPSWFQDAIRDVVRQLGAAPFLELVRFGSGDPRTPAQLSSFSVPQGVVAAPELWRAVAETVSSRDSPDVVILVQRVDGGHAAAEDPAGADAAAAGAHHPHGAEDLREHVEAACRQLVASGVGRGILVGQVGECCDGHEAHEPEGSAPAVATIVPFRAASAPQRTSVRANAIPSAPPGAALSSSPTSGYWGVVVQSRSHNTGAEGCYLLKAVRNVASHADGCTCIHFSLTRVCEGENLERQFVQSWLA